MFVLQFLAVACARASGHDMRMMRMYQSAFGKQIQTLIFFIVKMTYFKIIHHSELIDHDAVKVIGQKLYDHPFRTYVHFKPNRVKLLQGILGTECKIQKIPLKFLKIEIEGLN